MWGNLQEGIEGLERVTPELCREWRDGGLDYARLTANGFSHKQIEIPISEFEAYLAKVDYNANFTSYIDHFASLHTNAGRSALMVNNKLLEQFLAVYLTSPGSGATTMDVAAAFGPFAKILKDFYGVERSFHQDLNVPNKTRFSVS